MVRDLIKSRLAKKLRGDALFWAFIIASVYLVGYPALNNFFVYDDGDLLLDTETIFKDPAKLLKTYNTFFRPAVRLTLYPFVRLFGNVPAPYYHLNLLVHVANTALVFSIIGFFGLPKAPRMFATTVFALNPFYLEVYRFIANYNELSFAFFFLATVYLYIRSDRTRAYAALTFLGAVLSKESGVILAPILLTYDIVVTRGGLRQTVRRILPIVYAFSLYVLIYVAHGLAVGKFTQTKYYFGVHGFYNLALNVALAAAGPLYSVPSAFLRGGAKYAAFAALAAGAVALATYIAIKRRKELAPYGPAVVFGLLWLVLGLAPVGFWRGTHTAAARYFYLPYVGFALVIGVLFATVLPVTRKSGRSFFIAAVAVYSAYAVVASSLMPFNERASSVYRTWYETVKAAGPYSKNTIILVGGGPKLSRDNILHGRHDVALYKIMFPEARAEYHKTEDPGEALGLAEAGSPATVILWSDNEPVSVIEYD